MPALAPPESVWLARVVPGAPARGYRTRRVRLSCVEALRTRSPRRSETLLTGARMRTRYTVGRIHGSNVTSPPTGHTMLSGLVEERVKCAVTEEWTQR